MISLRVTQSRTAALLLYFAGIPFAAHAADSSSTTIAMSNIATPGAVADADLAHEGIRQYR